MQKEEIISALTEIELYLTGKLLPFWLNRCKDDKFGGFITHFDKDGNDSGEDEKSLIAQSRTVYTMSAAHRAGYGDGACLEYAKHGIDFLLNKMWDKKHGGFFWLMDRKGRVKIDQKIIYGHSFAIYSLSEYTLASGDPIGLVYAEKVFDLLQKYCVDTMYGGYFEMFDFQWNLCGPGSAGGDRKTLDCHMHLMEAFTTLFEASRKSIHRRKLLEDINILLKRMMHPEYGTGIPQFWPNWEIAPQIKFDIVWGWDRFGAGEQKEHADDNTSYGHNVEFAWLLIHALNILEIPLSDYQEQLLKSFNHACKYGIDHEYGGVYVEGSHDGKVYDFEKEFWQQAELLIGMLDACLYFDATQYWPEYQNIHRFIFDKGINHPVGEWWPLLKRDGEKIWTHMSHSWKVNYHSVRAMVQSVIRLKKLLKKIKK